MLPLSLAWKLGVHLVTLDHHLGHISISFPN
jgi:hypothetical protein